MKNEIERTVYYADTDSYGVVWHGTYLRWLEQGRVEFCRNLGLDLIELKNQDITIPVTNISIRYKSSAKLNDNVLIETSVNKVTPVSITFLQKVLSLPEKNVYVIAEVEVVAVNNIGKIYRRLPEVLKTACLKSQE